MPLPCKTHHLGGKGFNMGNCLAPLRFAVKTLSIKKQADKKPPKTLSVN